MMHSGCSASNASRAATSGVLALTFRIRRQTQTFLMPVFLPSVLVVLTVLMTVATQSFGKDVQEDVAEHAARGEA